MLLTLEIPSVGEMIVAGSSLARCYLNDDIKTQAAFVSDLPWAKALGLDYPRFYRTGDLLRYNVDAFDGSYDFVGRKDTQIKLRGQRLEIGEVEHLLASIPGVAVSMVTRPKNGCFAGQLVAVIQMRATGNRNVHDQPITTTAHQALTIDVVRKHLSKSLPAYMWPAACLEINRMPFVPSMKINRRMVEDWLAGMNSRPEQVGATMLSEVRHSLLDPSEITANALSVKYAELVASKDHDWLLKLKGSNFSLQKAGMDSIQLVSFSMFLQKTYGVKIPTSRLLNSKTTIRDLASLIDHHDTLSPAHYSHIAVDVLGESRALREELLRKIESENLRRYSAPHFPPSNIFLTGATGYLGLAILQSLMARPEIVVFALVRCVSGSEGLQQIKDAASNNGWWQEAYDSRIHVWKGDLTEGSFGLNDEQLGTLRGKNRNARDCIHAVIHNGAKVHYSLDYESLKAVNVQSTVDLLQITASSVHLSTFVYVSGGQKPCTEAGQLGFPLKTTHLDHGNGYTQSKFVSEDIVGHCAQHVLFHDKRLHTTKPGYIIGSLTAGVAKQPTLSGG